MDDVDDGINDPRLPGGGGYDKCLGPVAIPSSARLARALPPSGRPSRRRTAERRRHRAGRRRHLRQRRARCGGRLRPLHDGELWDRRRRGRRAVARPRDARADEGVAAIATLVNDGGTTTVGPTSPAGSYSYVHTPEPTRPDGSLWSAAAWTPCNTAISGSSNRWTPTRTSRCRRSRPRRPRPPLARA